VPHTQSDDGDPIDVLVHARRAISEAIARERG
jgi:inorganic pyrophosphatase